MSRGPWVAFGIGSLAALAALGIATTPVVLTPDGPGWDRCVRGATGGRLHRDSILLVPGVDRRGPLSLEVDAEPPSGRSVRLGLTLDEGGSQRQDLTDAPLSWRVPPTGSAGLLARLTASEDGLELRSIALRSSSGLPWGASAVLLLAVAGLVLALQRSSLAGDAASLGVLAAGLVALAASPLLLFWTLPRPAALWRLALPLLLILCGAVMGLRGAEARRFRRAGLLLAAAIFGAWVRAYFLPAPGSWDTDYWKACMRRVATHGVTRAYGDPGWPSLGQLSKQLSGEEPLWEAESFGRTFVVDQPPGIMAEWRASWWLAERFGPEIHSADLENAAAKLPPVAGDLLAVGILLWTFRERPGRGVVLAALYWALPISWLSSAVLGYFDGAGAPLALAALVAAGRGRSALSGALLALAALVKSTALLVAPAVLVALIAARVPVRRAMAWGSAVVGAALLPFLLDGTLITAVVHCYRIIFQKRLSGGFANGWWILSQLVAVAQGKVGLWDRVPFVHISNVHFPVNALGAVLFLLVALFLARLQLRRPGPLPATLVGAMLVVSYGMLAIGVHENHPHLLVLAFLATGLPSSRLRLLAGLFLTSYVLNMLALSGLGRYGGSRYHVLAPLMNAASAFRMSPGFDVTLLLAVINIGAYAVLLAGIGREMDTREDAAHPC